MAGLLATYGLRTEGDPVTMDLGLLYAALKSHKVDMIAANSTDGLAAVLDVAMLEDDRHYFPPYECAVVAREEHAGAGAGAARGDGGTLGKVSRRGDAQTEFRRGWRAPAARAGGVAVSGLDSLNAYG